MLITLFSLVLQKQLIVGRIIVDQSGILYTYSLTDEKQVETARVLRKTAKFYA